ncbi:DUF5801 repeats-in-toxin domain-containing protein [Roseibium album]|uniref:T1SS-143 repeat domain-containing protein n=1 Tax=Roseibium album TaxID=311410 RepID=UPI003298F9F9
MNEFVRIAQANISTGTGNSAAADGASEPLVVDRPAAQSSVVALRNSGQLVDFRQILDEDISFFRIDGDLQMIFADGGMVIIQDFFEGDSGAEAVIVGDNELLSIDGFVSLANLQLAEEIQTAAGETSNLATALGSSQSSGQNFEPTEIGDLGNGLGFGDLLRGELPGERAFLVDDFSESADNTGPDIGTPVDSTLDEENLEEGTGPDGPVSVTASLDVDFGENPGGTPRLEFDGLPGGLTSDGVSLVLSVVTNPGGGQTLTAVKAGTGEAVFTVTLDVVSSGGSPGGQYTFDLFGNLDHIGDGQDTSIPLVFGFSAYDSDGDADSDTFTVNIIDDEPETGESEQLTLGEENLDDGTDPDASSLTKAGELNIAWGADNADDAVDAAFQDAPGGTANRSVVFAAISDQPTIATSSDGVALQYELSENDTVLTAYKGDDRGDANKVFIVTLFDDGTGSYTFELLGNIDHVDSASGLATESRNLDFAFVANDGDGDAVTGGLRVTIEDDEPQAGEPVQRTLQEHDLATGTDPDSSALVKTGDLDITWGADDADAADDGAVQDTPGGAGNRSIVFAAIADQPTQATTSDGLALEYVLSENGTVLTAYKGDDRGDKSKVFVVSLSDDGSGSYTFELLGNLDHNPPGSTGKMVSWNLDFGFVARDGDGDAVASEFRVTIVDDEPEAGIAESVTLREHDLASGTDPDATALTQTGNLNFTFGADDGDTADSGGLQDTPGGTGNRSVVFAAIADQPTQLTTSDGIELDYVLNSDGTVLTAYKGDGRTDADKVFVVSLSDDGSGSYTFELLGNIDHDLPGSGAMSESWDLDFAVIASDSDGDTVEGDFRVSVVDDAPLSSEPVASAVEEEDLPGGNDDRDPFDIDGLPADLGTPLTEQATASLNITWGADDTDSADTEVDGLPVQDTATAGGQRSVVFSDAADGEIVDIASVIAVEDGEGAAIDPATLTSRGDALSYVLSNDGTLLTAYANYGDTEERSVFRVALSDDAEGSYQFILDDTLDHPLKGTSSVEEDVLSLSFDFIARDSDGDTSTDAFTVQVIDDSPSIASANIHDIGVVGPVTYDSGVINLAIPDDGNLGEVLSSTIEVPEGGTIRDLNLSLVLDHDWMRDLKITLIAPNGTLVRLVEVSGADGAVDGTVTLDDEAANSLAVATPPFAGSWRPTVSDLDLLDGLSQEGTWTLQIDDVFVKDTGSLVSWSLTIETGGVAALVDEDDLPAGNMDSQPGDAATVTNDSLDTDGDATTVYGELAIFWGADNENSVPDGGTSAGNGDRAVTFVEGDGGSVDELVALGLTSNGEELSYTLNGSLDILTATAGGRVIFTVELFDTGSGSFKFDLEDSLDHPEGADENDLILDFLYVATDSDGDTSTSTFSVGVDDDTPVVGDGVERATLDEDDIVSFFSIGSEPSDGNADGSTTGFADIVGPAFAEGSLATLVDFGADGRGDTGGFSFSPTAAADMEALGLQSRGEVLAFAVTEIAGSSFLFGYVDDGDGSFDLLVDRPVISLQLETDGDYAVRLHDQLDHVSGNGQNSVLDTVSGSLSEIDFGAVIEVTDADGDGSGLTGKLLVDVTDDVPVPEIAVVDYVRIDETYGLHSDNVFDPSTGEFDPEIVDLFSGITATGSDADLPGPIYASFGVVGFDAAGGADDDPSVELSLRIDDPASGITTTDGKAITLSLEGDLVVGRIDGDGDAAFAIHLDEDGNVSIAQYLSLKHPDPTSSDEHISLAGKISAVLTVTDADGDTVSNDVSIGADVTFDDDGPTAFRRGSSVAKNEADTETSIVSGQLQFDGGADGATVTGITFISDGDYIRTFDPDASGADRRGTLSADGVPVIWSSSTDAGGVITVTAVLEGTATKAFELVVNPDGNYTYEQFVGLDHPDAGETGRADQLIFRIRFTVTDGDGDTDAANATIRIRDGGPEIGTVDGTVVEEDGTRTLESIDLGIEWGIDDANDDDGAPGDRSVGFSEATAVDNVSFADADGALTEIYSDGELVNFAIIDGILVGYVGAAVPVEATESSVVLTVSLSDEGTGSYDFELLQPLDHTTSVGTDRYLDLTFSFKATDADGDNSEDGAFTVRVDAAGTVTGTSVDYSGLTSGVFVNLSDAEKTILGQTVAGETATDRDDADPALVGADSMEGIDEAIGGAGDDVLVGNDNNNTLTGNGGNDALNGGGGINLLDGGEGTDTADYSNNSEAVLVRMDLNWSTDLANQSLGFTVLADAIAADTIDHDNLVSIENVTGSDFNDTIFGDGQANTISGGEGNDFIAGFGGNDTLIGGAGNDDIFGVLGNNKLAGGTGQDRLFGGTGADEFVFAAGEGSASISDADQVFFFQDGSDKITITGGLTFADLTIGSDAFGRATIFDNVNGQYVAVITGVSPAALSASDFNFSSDPIILDLDGDGVELISAENGVDFDVNADGIVEQTGWVGSDDGLLVMDVDGSGAIENGSEIFSESFNGGSYADSLEALASLDDNGDGVIDAGDAAFNDIKVWQDANSDGVVQEGELKSLVEHDVASIDLGARPVYQDVDGNTVFAEGTFTKTDGSTGEYAGAAFAVANVDGPDAEETTRQSTAIAAGVALVIYAASSDEVAAGLTSVSVTRASEHGELTVSDDFTVTFTSSEGYVGDASVEIALNFADGNVVTRAVELEVLAADTAATGSSPTSVSGTVVADIQDQPENDSDINPVENIELGAIITGSTIRGDDGDNVLVGTDGDDILIGGLGSDTLTGGAGADTFVLNSLAEADIITDYAFADGDRIDLGELLDGAFGPGADVEEFVQAQKEADGAITLKVDRDGDGTAHDWQDAATLQDHASMGETIRVVLDSDGSEAQIPVNIG